MSVTKIQPPDKLDSSSVDNEHRVQIGLLNALDDAINDKKSASEINQVLDQLVSYSELHFMSEELLMRQYAYPDYDDHVNDHATMTEFLKDIMKMVTTGQDGVALKTSVEMRQFLDAHIGTRDEAFSEYLNKAQANMKET